MFLSELDFFTMSYLQKQIVRFENGHNDGVFPASWFCPPSAVDCIEDEEQVSYLGAEVFEDF